MTPNGLRSAITARWISITAVALASAACASSRPVAPRAKPAPGPVASFAIDAAVEAGSNATNPVTPLDHVALFGHACTVDPTAWGDIDAQAAPFSRPSGTCSGPFCDIVEAPPDPKDTCFVATSNIARAEKNARAAPPAPSAIARAAAATASTPTTSATTPSHTWDGHTPPQYLDRVDEHLHLRPSERELLAANHFVALDRLAPPSYAIAYHNIFQEQLPLFVSVDSILFAVFQGHGAILESIEVERLGPELYRLLSRLRSTLMATRKNYPRDTANDLDVYLSIAWALFVQDPTHASQLGNQELVTQLLHEVEMRRLTAVTLFGRPRMVDFSQLEPRGHYQTSTALIRANQSTSPTLAAYFQAMMWLSRLELNLVSRSCRSSQPGDEADPSETPREAGDAIALADLVKRAGATPLLDDFERVYGVFGGTREDVSLPELSKLAARAKVSGSTVDPVPALKQVIGGAYQRTTRIHYMPQNAPVLPVITTMFGPRIVPDTAPLTMLVHDAVPGRFELGAGDLGFVLGHDRAMRYIDDLAPPAATAAPAPTLTAAAPAPTLTAAALAPALTAARADLTRRLGTGSDVYTAWLKAVVALAKVEKGTRPSFMQTDAYADMRLNSALVGYGQIRHNYVLMAGQGYDAYGCEIPDGYVEPAIATYDALVGYARRARAIDPKRERYFARLEQVATTLSSISATELSGAPLSKAQREWLGMVAEFTPVGGYGGDSGEPPKYTGWYFDLFPDHEHGAEKRTDFVADYFTLTNANKVQYIGAEGIRLGVFVVDTGGGPRAMVGPVAKGYALSRPIARRLNDDRARRAHPPRAAWLGYMADAHAGPGVRAEIDSCTAPDGATRVAVAATVRGRAEAHLLDHHGDPVSSSASGNVGPTGSVFAFRDRKHVSTAAKPSATPPTATATPNGALGLGETGFAMPRSRPTSAAEGVHVRFFPAAGGEPIDVVSGPSVYPPPYDEPGDDEADHDDAPGNPDPTAAP